MKNLTLNLGFLAILLFPLFIASCGEKCADTCVNGTCESTTATQSECVCDDGYYDENCSKAANADMDMTVTEFVCGKEQEIVLSPDNSDPLKFQIRGLSSSTVTVTITGNTNTSGVDDIYHLSDLSIERQSYSSTESIVSTAGFFNRGDFLSLDYDILNASDSITGSCSLFIDLSN